MLAERTRSATNASGFYPHPNLRRLPACRRNDPRRVLRCVRQWLSVLAIAPSACAPVRAAGKGSQSACPDGTARLLSAISTPARSGGRAGIAPRKTTAPTASPATRRRPMAWRVRCCGRSWANPAPIGAERAMLDSIEKRVKIWNEVEPFYSDAKSGPGKEVGVAQRRVGAQRSDPGQLRPAHGPPERHHARGLRQRMGAAIGDRAHHRRLGVAELSLHAVGIAGERIPRRGADGRGRGKGAGQLSQRSEDRRQSEPAGSGYLTSHYDAQPLLNRVIALWASARFPPACLRATSAQRALCRTDRQAAPGRRLEHHRSRHLEARGRYAARDAPSDGYATGVVLVALEEKFV